MPLYDFSCRSCGTRFEALIRQNDSPCCPHCGSTDAERMVSLFAVSSDSTRKANLAAARKSGAKQAEEKRRADQEEAHHHHH